MRKYAQILKSDNTVNLIGGAELGLPVHDHPLVSCIDITDRTDTIELYMVYDASTNTFAYPNPVPEAEPTDPMTEVIDKYTLTLIQSDLLK